MNKYREVFHQDNLMICIGYNTSGFWIYDNCKNRSNHSNLGINGQFELPEGIQAGSNEANSYLAGSQNFKVS